MIHLENGCSDSWEWNIARKLPDLCACVLYPWGKITCTHNIISTLRFPYIVSWFKIYHHCLCYVFNHVDTSWPSGVLENQHVNWVQYFEYFCPGTPCSIQLQILQYISYHLYCTPAKLSFSNMAWKAFSLVTNWKELTDNKRKWHSNVNAQPYHPGRSLLGSCLGDMAVRMPDRGLVFERVTCFYCSKRVTFLVIMSNVCQFL